MKREKTLEQAAQELAEAVARYEAARAVSESARREETAALNALNCAQKEFDASVRNLTHPWRPR